jgi:hypothetical protein
MDPEKFGCSVEEMIESLEEFGCTHISSLDLEGQVRYYAIANSKEILLNMCVIVELDGSIIEYIAIYDQTFED